jgi:hypothetical protein
VDPRVVRAGEAGRKRDDVLGGYRLGWQQAQHILTDVAYLGWRVRAGEIAWDPSANAPRVCHPPLVESDLFWWCFDQIVAERPPWAPPRPAQIHLVTRPRRARADPPGHVRFLAHGRVRCAVHETTFAVRKTGERSWLQCNGNDFRVYRGQGNCPALYTPALEDALCRGFAEQLTLDEQDLQELARILDRRTQVAGGQEQRLRQEIADKKTMYARAVELALRAQNDQLAEDLLEQARQAQQVLAVREVELAHLSAAQPFSAQAWFAAQRAATLAERIRATFAEWSRTAKARVLACALDDAVLGYVDRHLIGLWLRWQGGNQSRFEVPSLFGKHVGWTDEEQQAVRRYYPTLTQDALLQVLPARTWTAIKTFAKRQGIVRPNPGTSLRRCHRLSCRA